MKKVTIKLIKQLADDALFYEQEYKAMCRQSERFYEENCELKRQLLRLKAKAAQEEPSIAELARGYKDCLDSE